MRRWLVAVIVAVVVYVSLFVYAHFGVVVLRYEWPGYFVEYVRYPRLPWPLGVIVFEPSNVYPLINVMIEGAPKPYPHVNARFFIYATGPSPSGFVSIGHYRTDSTSFTINVGNYTTYALKLDEYLK